MGRGRKNDSSNGNNNDGGEIQVSKSPAEFFAENQAIAGFDNIGKSLYTSIRELMENSLDACESIGVLPDLSVTIEEFTQEEFNDIRGLNSPKNIKKTDEQNDSTNDTVTLLDDHQGVDLFQDKKKTKGRKSTSTGKDQQSDNTTTNTKTTNNAKKPGRQKQQDKYFRIQVRDNGCGMRHEDIPNLLGRVLSGSKYGVRQTRGKFGLGSKMALIWSKKSTGAPIKIITSHRPSAQSKIPTHISTCVLDIDIYHNRPRILKHTQTLNTGATTTNNDDQVDDDRETPHTNNSPWLGTMVEIFIGGNWTTYKSRIVQYIQQLAIITPYAKLKLNYRNSSDSKKNMTIHYDRRSEQMPLPAREVKHHPSSVNNLLIQQLLEQTKTQSFIKFLTTELSCIPPSLAKRLIQELNSSSKGGSSGITMEESMSPKSFTDKQITRLVLLLRSVTLFKAPDGTCLSPLGEYNLNLGIRKVLEPIMVATYRDKPSAYEGHPFIVEGAVSLGGKDVKEGITVVRFANRIPLLFEGGADVASRVALTKIKWSNYKIDYKRDKIGVFISIVSTKIPYKGTGKEYIGDDILEISNSVKRTLQNCCQQLRSHLMKRNALRDIKERKSRLFKYVPDVTRSIYSLLDGIRKRKLGGDSNNEEENSNEEELDSEGKKEDFSTSPRMIIIQKKKKKRKLNEGIKDMIHKLDQKEITEKVLETSLRNAIEQQGEERGTAVDGDDNPNNKKHKKQNNKMDNQNNIPSIPLFIVPLHNFNDKKHDIQHPLFTFRPMMKKSIETIPK